MGKWVRKKYDRRLNKKKKRTKQILRKILENMKADGLVSSGEGRAGARLTLLGRKKFNISE